MVPGRQKCQRCPPQSSIDRQSYVGLLPDVCFISDHSFTTTVSPAHLHTSIFGAERRIRQERYILWPKLGIATSREGGARDRYIAVSL
jgi:hypothetical protein